MVPHFVAPYFLYLLYSKYVEKSNNLQKILKIVFNFVFIKSYDIGIGE